MSNKTGKPKKVWKGEKRSGPAPARHIPWPEVFKHHISVVEGHLKMCEMIQKHTVPGTSNFKTISELVDRSHEMLRQSKSQSLTFVPPANQRETVPLGSSSESTYPGYSPAHITYGEAAKEVGNRIGALKAAGAEWKPPADAPEYQIGQGHGQKRKLYHADSSDTVNGESPNKNGDSNADISMGDPMDEDTEQPVFFEDLNPSPLKRTADETPEKGPEKKKNKAVANVSAPTVETEDISEEVEANLKAKEKAKSKDGKKRRRSSGGDEIEGTSKKSKKEKKEKKDKKAKRSAETEVEAEVEAEDGEGKKKKKRKKGKESKESE